MKEGQIIGITGTQWGDEGKGKIVNWFDTYRQKANIVARWQGGNNAGHTITVGNKVHKLHYVPGGAVTGKDVLLGHDMVIHLQSLINEVELLHGKIDDWGSEQIYISGRAHVTLDHHIVEDGLIRSKQGKFSADSTLRGIAPTYADKALRSGIRFGDLLNRSMLKSKLEVLLDHKEPFFRSCNQKDFDEVRTNLTKWYGAAGENIFLIGEDFDVDFATEWYHNLGVKLEKNICDTTKLIHDRYNAGETIVAEGAQGFNLDLTHGAYPYTTSSHPVIGAMCVGLGVPPRMIKYSIGVVKAFESRVGGGPLPTELYRDFTLNMTKKQQDALAIAAGEIGTTSGRTRRLLWLDGVQLARAAQVNGFDEIAITKLDMMPRLSKYSDCLKIATEYVDSNGRSITEPPTDWAGLDDCSARYYEYRPIWEHKEPDEWMAGVVDPKKPPNGMEPYIRRVAGIMNVKNTILSVGPDRDATFEFAVD